MIDAFATALGTALTGFVTDVSDAITANVPTTLTITFGLAGISLLIGVVLKLVRRR